LTCRFVVVGREIKIMPARCPLSGSVASPACQAGQAAFEFTLDRIGWFAEEVVWLGPRDPAPLAALTSLVYTAFPSWPPPSLPPRSSDEAVRALRNAPAASADNPAC
jgi:hypothetical protein